MGVERSSPTAQTVFRGRPAFTAIQKRTPVEPWNTEGVPGGAKPWAGGAVTTGAAGAGRGFGMLFTFGLGRPGLGKRKAGSRLCTARWCTLPPGAAASGTAARRVAVPTAAAMTRTMLRMTMLRMTMLRMTMVRMTVARMGHLLLRCPPCDRYRRARQTSQARSHLPCRDCEARGHGAR